jgi:hypothetical protein
MPVAAMLAYGAHYGLGLVDSDTVTSSLSPSQHLPAGAPWRDSPHEPHWQARKSESPPPGLGRALVLALPVLSSG